MRYRLRIAALICVLFQVIRCAPTVQDDGRFQHPKTSAPAGSQDTAERKEIQKELDAYDSLETYCSVGMVAAGTTAGIIGGVMHRRVLQWYDEATRFKEPDSPVLQRQTSSPRAPGRSRKPLMPGEADLIGRPSNEGGIVRIPATMELSDKLQSKMRGVSYIYAVSLAFLLAGIYRLVHHALLNPHSKVQVKKDAYMPDVAMLAELKTEACVKMNDLGEAADGAGEDEHGVESWHRHWDNFESVFESAQDVAHQKVLDNITDSPIEAWPILDPEPEVADNSTAEQQFIFDQEFQVWSEKNMLTIPRMKHDIASRYYNMHHDETMEAVWQQNDHPAFVDYPELFQQLSRTFLYRGSLPRYCLTRLHEPKSVSIKMENMRNSTRIRNAAVEQALGSLFERKTNCTQQIPTS